MKNTNKQFINHITINTGNSARVPRGQVSDSLVEVLKPLVIGGGGVIPQGDGQYRFVLNSEGGRSCVFSFWRDTVPIALCGFQEKGEGADELWEMLNERYGTETRGNFQMLSKPIEPWLGVVILPTFFLGMSALPWLVSFEQGIAETWRRLSASERSPISMSQEVMAAVGWTGIHEGVNENSAWCNSTGMEKEMNDWVNTFKQAKVSGLNCDLEILKKVADSLANASQNSESVFVAKETALKAALNAKDRIIQDLKSKSEELKIVCERIGSSRKLEQQENSNLKSQLIAIIQENVALKSRNQVLSSDSIHQELASLKTIIEEKSLEVEIKDDDHSKAIAESLSHTSDLERHNAYLVNLLRKKGISFNPIFGHGDNNEGVAA